MALYFIGGQCVCGYRRMGRMALRVVTFGIAFAMAMLVHVRPSSSEAKTVAQPAVQPTAPIRIPGKGIVALDARLAGDEKRTRLIVDLSKKVDISVYTLAGPARVVIDLPDVSFDFPVNAGRAGRGLVTTYRYGLLGPGKARIVLDVSGPVKIEKSFVQEEFDDQPARLVVEIVRSDAGGFKSSLAEKSARDRCDGGHAQARTRGTAHTVSNEQARDRPRSRTWW